MSKDLYNLCRKYKHFYIKNRDVMSWNEKYHDVDLSDAVNQTKLQLDLVEHELLKQLFKDTKLDVRSIDTNFRYPNNPFSFNSRLQYHPQWTPRESTVEILNSERFMNILAEYMRDCRDKYVLH